MKKGFAIIMAVLAIGVIISFTLPSFDKSSSKYYKIQNYTINQPSLSSPLPMKDFLLITPHPIEAEFTLQLGLYSQLQQAIIEVKKIIKSDVTTKALSIVKTTDGTREWYLILLGQYKTMVKAEEQKQWLQNNQQSATLLLLPKDFTL